MNYFVMKCLHDFMLRKIVSNIHLLSSDEYSLRGSIPPGKNILFMFLLLSPIPHYISV